MQILTFEQRFLLMQCWFWLRTSSPYLACAAGAKRWGEGEGEKCESKRVPYPLSPISLPFPLPPHPLPLSTPVTQATPYLWNPISYMLGLPIFSSLTMYGIHLKHSQGRNKTLPLRNLQFSLTVLNMPKMVPAGAESRACLYCILKIGET